ncbi:MAG: sulfotransferase [Nodosilinea sp. WJT8-NPBG4]|nr:sulfotransferase [Nodosilinea sp. WJT8-NPBG4]
MNSFFVIGCPRSGTTFLMECLAALPYTECVSGISFPVPMAHLAAQQLPEQTIHCLEYGLRSTLNVYLDAVPNSRFKAFHRLAAGFLGVSEAKKILQRRRQLQNLIYKEPFFSFSPSFLYRALPDCKIIYLYRDGRDCANSLVECYDVLTNAKLKTLDTSESVLGYQHKDFWIPWWVAADQADIFIEASPYVRSIWMWKEMVSCCESFFSQANVITSERILKIKYEDLAHEPIIFGEKIVNYIGADFDTRIQKRFRQASVKAIGKYKKRDALDIKLAEQVAHRELSLYGYIA